MWSLRNRTPYAAERGWTRDRDGNHLWLVAVKATFSLDGEGRARLADEQIPVRLLPEFHGEPGTSSLKYEADLTPIKPTTDVLLDAVAHAPRGMPVRSFEVGLRFGAQEKRLLVLGPRALFRGVSGIDVTQPLPFTSCAIMYEHAYGGTDATGRAYDARNPIGKGFALVGPDPNEQAWRLEYPRGNPKSIGPAGLGPLGPSWSPRREHAGTYDEAWVRDRRPLLPANYSDNFLLSSPEDQRSPESMRGGEWIQLECLTPSGLLQFQLPRIYLAFTTFLGGRRHEHRSRLGTVIIEPEHMRFQLVWNTALPIAPNDVDYVDQTLIREKRYLW